MLWHNPVEPLSACDDVNQIFWTQLSGKTKRQERWISAEEFMNISMQRYHGAGLLRGLRSDLKPAVKRSFEDRLLRVGQSLDVETLSRGFYRGDVQLQKYS